MVGFGKSGLRADKISTKQLYIIVVAHTQTTGARAHAL